VPGEFELDLSGENVDHLGSCFPETTDPIYGFAWSLESDSDNDHEVFMLGQGDTLVDQIEQGIAEGATAKITRSKKLAKGARSKKSLARGGSSSRANFLSIVIYQSRYASILNTL
jgi:hypothetical protein